MTAFATFLFIFFGSRSISHEDLVRNQFILWNVGQGQWITVLSQDRCLHFDFGGERTPQELLALCQHRLNELYLSHWDWDHWSGIYFLKRNFLKLCHHSWPPWALDKRKLNQKKKIEKAILAIPPCSIKEVQRLTVNAASKTSNSSSQVFLYKEAFLIPGDSPISEEKKWAAGVDFKQTEVLVLGHHGSLTSSSDFLLRKLPKLKMALASAREAKYGHPHAKTLHRLKKKKTPVLRTEDWGHIFLEIKIIERCMPCNPSGGLEPPAHSKHSLHRH